MVHKFSFNSLGHIAISHSYLFAKISIRIFTDSSFIETAGEKCQYDHVGIKASIFDGDNEIISEKISKDRRCGYTEEWVSSVGMSVISYSGPIVVPGCVLWSVGDCDVEQLHAFQRYVARSLHDRKWSHRTF